MLPVTTPPPQATTPLDLQFIEFLLSGFSNSKSSQKSPSVCFSSLAFAKDKTRNIFNIRTMHISWAWATWDYMGRGRRGFSFVID